MRLPFAPSQILQGIVVAIQTGYHREHNVDDSHGTIHASGSIAERGRTAAMGESIPVPFTPASFTASGGMTWGVAAVGNQTTFVYTLIGKWMIVAFDIVASSVTAPLSSTLQITIPGGFVAARTIVGTFWYSDNGTAGTGRVFSTAGSRIISLLTLAGGNWTASVANTTIQGELLFEVQ